MNTLEPEGGRQNGHTTLTIKLQSSSGSPWTGAIHHNGQVHRLDTAGKASLKINGGEVYINGITVTKKIREAVKEGASEIILRHDMSTGNLKKID